MSTQLHYCPNCAYLLVLLEKRGKYKCAKCGKLFLQQDIENGDFRKWNEIQREEDVKNIKQRKPRVKLTEEEKKERAKGAVERWRLNNKEKVREYDRRRDRKEYQMLWYHKNLDKLRSDGRLKQWRKKQKILALQYLRNIEEKAYNSEFWSSLPTNPLSYLLSE